MHVHVHCSLYIHTFHASNILSAVVIVVLYISLFSWSRFENKTEVTDYMMSVLLKYLAHPVSSIRKEPYQAVLTVLKVCFVVTITI